MGWTCPISLVEPIHASLLLRMSRLHIYWWCAKLNQWNYICISLFRFIYSDSWLSYHISVFFHWGSVSLRRITFVVASQSPGSASLHWHLPWSLLPVPAGNLSLWYPHKQLLKRVWCRYRFEFTDSHPERHLETTLPTWNCCYRSHAKLPALPWVSFLSWRRGWKYFNCFSIITILL